jgi:nuclear cap-binding protein subunit 1
MPQVLAQATEILYEKLDTMNAACIDRFASWFAYHLSNFQFKWSWDDWSDCLDVDLDMPKPKFVRETLLKCLRLSYHQRVSEIVPATFAKLVPAKPAPDFKYEREGSLPGMMAAHQLMQAVRAKCSPNEVEDILRELPNPLRDTAGYNPLKIDVCVQTLLFMASKSFSHSFAAISKFHPLLKSLGSTPDAKTSNEAQQCILRSLYELWHDHQQMMVVLIDKLLKTQIIECQAVANWIFSPDMSSDLTCFYVWEILYSTIRKMNTQVKQLQKHIEEMRDKMDAHDRKRREGYQLGDDDRDVPTEEAIEKEEDRLEEMLDAQKNLYLVIFQRFIMILTEHLTQSESTQRDYNTPWYKWIIERLQQVFLLHHEQVYKYVSSLESLLFTSDIDLHILEVFQQFCALRS